MELIQVSKKNFHDFVTKQLEGTKEVVGVIRKGKHFAFSKLEQSSDLCLDYDETILPPKKFFMPVKETLLTYEPKNAASYKEVYDETQRTIIGIHPGDLAAIALLDRAFSEGESDGHYLRRREASTLIGIYPTKPYKYRFTNSMIQEEAYKSADCFLIDLGEYYGVEVLTEKGKAWAAEIKTSPAMADLEEKIAEGKKKVVDEISMPIKRGDLPEFLANKDKHEEWQKRGDKCFSCGSCVLVCPTCYCFDVRDEVELSLQKGARVRRWDGCTLDKFANVAGNHNFRGLAADRLKHRLHRKAKYLMERFGMPGCVGCGRCAQSCVANIASPVDIVNELMK